MKAPISLILAALLVAGLTLPVSAAIRVDSDLRPYLKTRGVSGNLSSQGSDTLANLMTLWAGEFKRYYPNVNIQVQASGSSAAPPALTEGTSNLGPMSRPMKPSELQAFERRHGYPVTAVPVAIDAVALYVHKDNPIDALSLQQVDAVFSSTRNCRGPDDIRSWQQLGLDGIWLRRDIQLFGRNSVSGTYGYFKQKALCSGDYKDSVNEQPGSASVVSAVSTSIAAIGYSGIGYRTAGVRAVPLRSGGKLLEATAENAATGSYPLARYLYLYVNKPPDRQLPPLEREFLRFVLSGSGQQVVIRDGYIPLSAVVVEKYLGELGL